MKVGLDTNILVELLTRNSVRHVSTRACYERHRKAGVEFVVTGHALLEAFSVLSRSPKPVGVPPLEAERLLREGFGNATIAPFGSGLAWDAIRHTLSQGYWGGRVYDAAIALSTYEAGARLLLTWNVRDLHAVAPVGLEVRQPEER